MNILARILSHGFAIVVVILLAVGFMYRGDLFPDLPMPAFLGIERPAVDGTGTTTAADTDRPAAEPEAATDADGAPGPAPLVGEAATEPEPAGETVTELTSGQDGAPVTDTGTDMPTQVTEEGAGTAAAITAPDMAEPEEPVQVQEPEPEPAAAAEESGTPDVEDAVKETAPAEQTGGETVDSIPAEDTVPSLDMAEDDAGTPEPSADATAASDTSVSEEVTPDTDTAAAEQPAATGPETGDTAAAGGEAEPTPPAADVDAVIEPEPLAGAPAADTTVESAPPVPAPVVEDAVIPGDEEPAGIAAPVDDVMPSPVDPIPPSATSVETTLDMTRPYHVLAAAREAYWMRNNEEAESLYRQLIALEPENPDGYGELGNLYFSLGRWEDAASAYFEAGSRLARTGHIIEAENLLEVIRGLNAPQVDELAGIIAEYR